jgi:hypothetical protein
MSHPTEPAYAAALHTLFDHVADLEASCAQAGKEALASDDPAETAVLQEDFYRFDAAAKAVGEAIRRVMRNDTARREPGLRAAQRFAIVNHHFDVSMASARKRAAALAETFCNCDDPNTPPCIIAGHSADRKVNA